MISIIFLRNVINLSNFISFLILKVLGSKYYDCSLNDPLLFLFAFTFWKCHNEIFFSKLYILSLRLLLYDILSISFKTEMHHLLFNYLLLSGYEYCYCFYSFMPYFSVLSHFHINWYVNWNRSCCVELINFTLWFSKVLSLNRFYRQCQLNLSLYPSKILPVQQPIEHLEIFSDFLYMAS